jgi:hypothetical protein
MAAEHSSLAVLTLNVWNREGPWPERLPLISSWIDRLQPDLIGLQEVVDASHTQELLGGLSQRMDGHDFGNCDRRALADSRSAGALVAGR